MRRQRKKEGMKKAASYFEIFLLIGAVFAFSFLLAEPVEAEISAVTPAQTNVCCEKTTYGAWCQNSFASNCDTSNGLRLTPTSCDGTSFCKQGCCYDSNEGICSENTPQLVCQQNKGTWADSASCEIPQCNLGCCVLDNQAAFVTLVRCKKLSAFYGLKTDFRSNIRSEEACIGIAQSQDRGACVYEEDFTKTCKLITKSECNAMKGKKTGNSTTAAGNVTFHKDFLCTAEELGTNCAMTKETACVEGKDEVYFKDSCGNAANIYDSGKANEPSYWRKIIAKEDSCGAGSSLGSSGSSSCGNCDYFGGSYCRNYDKSKDTKKPTYGNFVCRDLNCKKTQDGNNYRHGESWCIYDDGHGTGADPAGSRYWKHVCVGGEELVEPCADARQEVCIQDKITTDKGDFQQAACRVNRWQDCTGQKEKDDCLNEDKRDCQWIENIIGQDNFGAENASQQATAAESKEEKEVKKLKKHSVCLPDVPPGLNFWTAGDSQGICAKGNSVCEVGYEKKLIGKKKCVTNCECLESSWTADRQKVCSALGDCSASKKTCAGGKCEVKKGVGEFLKSGKFVSGTVSRIIVPIVGFASWLGISGMASGAGVLPAGTTQVSKPAGSASGVTSSYSAVQAATSILPAVIPVLTNSLPTGIGGGAGNLKVLNKFPLKGDLLDSAGKVVVPKGQLINQMIDETGWYNGKQVLDSQGMINAGKNGLLDAPAAATGAGATTQQPGWMAKMLGVTEGGGLMDGLITGAQWGAVAFALGYFGGGLLGFNKNNQMALGAAMGLGAFTWQFLSTYNFKGSELAFLGQGAAPFFIGLGVAAVVFVMMYKKTSTDTISFECKPYEPPTRGEFCEACNQDKFRPCSEYRCKSLGQACQLLNAGTGDEKCAWVNPNDVSTSTISPWTDALLKGHSYKDVKTRPPGTGMRVVRDSASDGCVKAFTPLSFGINTNEPTQCKIDYNSTINVRDVKKAYDEMGYYFGESNLYAYNHTQTLRLPGPAALAAQNISPEISNDGAYTMFVRCTDANGNINEDEFAIKFCVEKGPDTTPPKIEGTSIPSGMPVAFNTNDTFLEVYVNEPSTCKWNKIDTGYDLMENEMSCSENVWEINTNMLYKCTTTLNGLENRKDNQFYFRCKDQPYLEGTDKANDRNKNSESYSFVIKGSQPLNIKANSIKPNGTVQGFAEVISVNLELETENGYNKGDALCYYSNSNLESDFIKMFETGTNKHKQSQQLAPGTYVYYFKCIDLGGNADYNSTRFTIEVDRNAPQIVRIYNEGSNLKVETNEKSTCYYSTAVNQKCNFEIGEGKQMLYQNATAHYTEWKADTNMYIKCVDSSGNQPNPLDCSIIARPYNSKKA